MKTALRVFWTLAELGGYAEGMSSGFPGPEE